MSATAPRAGELLAQARFSGFGERNLIVAERALARLPQRPGARVLDLGCAAGDTVAFLALARPDAHITGIDISADSVATAMGRVAEEGVGERVELRTGDYLAEAFAPFDVIVADQVLHLAAAPSGDALAGKLARDLRPGGALVAEMAYAGPYNTALIGVRRVLRRVRGERVDRLALSVARRLHSGDLDPEQLRERLVYNYVIPERLASRRWDRTLAGAGLRLDERVAMRQTSVAQPRHHLSVYVKAA
jgi:SAM-dependent methyltransferase